MKINCRFCQFHNDNHDHISFGFNMYMKVSLYRMVWINFWLLVFKTIWLNKHIQMAFGDSAPNLQWFYWHKFKAIKHLVKNGLPKKPYWWNSRGGGWMAISCQVSPLVPPKKKDVTLPVTYILKICQNSFFSNFFFEKVAFLAD